MSVRRQLLVTLGVCFTIILGATFSLHLAQKGEADELASSFARERQEQLDEAVQEESHSLGLFARDYSGWDDMVNFVETLDPEWARLNIVEVMERFRLSAVWLIGPDGKEIYAAKAPRYAELPLPRFASRLVASKAWAEEAGGFYKSGELVVDVRAWAVQPTADTERKTEPKAWLLAARVMDGTVLELLGRKLQAQVGLHEPGETEMTIKDGRIVVHYPLRSLFGGRVVAEWHADFRIEALELGDHYNHRELMVLILSGVLLLGVAAWSIHRNVLQPLSLIGASLSGGTAGPLEKMTPGLTEFARIASLVRQSFWQREELQREIEERVKLGRDLHDGVIQNLYATGMGIAHGQRLVATEPAKAIARLEETRRTLNDTMGALRNFIARAEPEPTEDVNFSDACVTLFQTLRAHRDCELDLEVAAEADRSIAKAARANLLFIVREAVSNALRHGEAKLVEVILRSEGKGWQLVVRDNGRGCDFKAPPQTGRGLENIRARAGQLGGAAVFAQSAGGGAEVRVEWGARDGERGAGV